MNASYQKIQSPWTISLSREPSFCILAPAVAANCWTLKQWFLLNAKVGLSSFGGGNRILHYRNALTNNGLTEEEFSQIVAIAQLMPGPNLVNAVATIGAKMMGSRGCLVGLCGLIVPSLLIAVLMTVALSTQSHYVQTLLEGAALSGSGILLNETFDFAKRTLSKVSHSLLGGHWTAVLASGVVGTLSSIGVPLVLILALAGMTTQFYRRPL